ncbi:squalene/phytoene synthase family protein [Stakelama sp. CBK3Z-3]|uniref:Squalene/phytoene synthase family protein n=1 Tax=Stakelama flava TaxID=2860338 RepID=A0ABS6XGI4_9SPHN|nr:squalene/phytoene synthase family protein [Stakelama flava]
MYSTDNPERALVATYAPVERRRALLALLALDDVLAEVPRTTNEPALGQMRLIWWRDALTALDSAAPPAQPVLRAVANDVLRHDVTGAKLGEIPDGWAVLIETEDLDEAAMREYARLRGAVLFDSAGMALGGGDIPLAQAGEGWALADLARNLSVSDAAARAAGLARPLLTQALSRKWPVRLRALGAMAHIARMDLDTGWDRPVALGAPRRVARLGWHRLTGR